LQLYWRRLQLAGKAAGSIGSPAYSEYSGIFPLHFPRLDIELDATPEELSRMLNGIAAAWEKMGEERPHFSVLSEERFLPRNVAASVDQFWNSGEGEPRLPCSCYASAALAIPPPRRVSNSVAASAG
jgi:hypothetical protein